MICLLILSTIFQLSRPTARRQGDGPLSRAGLGARDVLLCWPWLEPSPAAAANVVLLLMDDAAASDVADMPTVRQLAREGATFDHAYTLLADVRSRPAPSSRPALYSHRNGVTQNSRPAVRGEYGDLAHTFAHGLHAVGVDTGLRRQVRQRRAALDPGLGLPRRPPGRRGPRRRLLRLLRRRSPGSAARRSPTVTAPGDYSVDVERGFALRDIGSAPRGRFLTMLDVGAPHNPLTPAPRYAPRAGHPAPEHPGGRRRRARPRSSRS